MIHNQPFNIYIASCDTEGGIYQYRIFPDGTIEYVNFTRLDRPMYNVMWDGRMYVLLRAPFKDSKNSGLIVYDTDEEGKLSNPSEIISTEGEVACHLCVNGDDVYCTNYISGSVVKIPSLIVRHNGRGTDVIRQEGPHTHFVGFTPDKKHICVTDLGIDTIFLYTPDMKLVSKAFVPEGSGARHLDFCDNRVYCINELKSTLSVFEFCGNGLKYLNTVPVLDPGFSGESTASAIRIRGNYCYTANRGHDSISVTDISNDKPELITTVLCGGESPRDFNIIGDMLICANEKSNNVTFFKIINGIPCKTDTEIKIKSPFCVAF